MKQALAILIFIQFCFTLQSQDPQKIINCRYVNIPFSEFCADLQKTTGLRVFYKDDLTENIRVTLYYDSITIFEAVRRATEPYGLTLSLWNNDIVVLKGIELLPNLPEYKQIEKEESAANQNVEAITETEELYITGRKPGVTETIIIGRAGLNTGNAKVKVLGRIMDEDTGEPLMFATIYISETKTGAVTDINGFFTLALASGNYNAQIESMGYEKGKYMLEVLSGDNFSITMKRSTIMMQEIVVSSERQASIKAKDAGLEQMSIKTIKELPMMMGERDILKVSGTLPGIVSAGDGGAGLNVRGSGSDQNAFYINRIPIYNTSHLFGFFPAFNSDIIKDFSIYKGLIPAQFGGRLASVFNITTRQGNRKNYTARGGISPIAGNLTFEGPLKKDTSSFLFSARSTYSDWLLSKIKDTTINASSANFNDFSGGINWDIQKTQVALFGYNSTDHFRLSEINRYSYSNTGASLIIGHNFSNSLRGELDFIGSDYSFATINIQEIPTAYEHNYKMDHYEARVSFKQMVNDKHSLEYGGGVILYKLDRGEVIPYGRKSIRDKVDLGNDKGVESSVFISDSYNIKPWMDLTMGFRYSLFTPIGSAVAYSYLPGAPTDLRYVADTLSFGKNEAIRWYHEPDLRAALNIETDENGSVKLAFNQMHQNVFMLNTTTSVAPSTQWKLADYHLIPSKSSQISVGIFRTIPKNGLEASVEVYYKRTYNYPEFKDGADFLDNTHVETAVLQGDQRAYGAEFFIKRSMRNLEGWISYTWSRSLIQVNGEHSWNKINKGEPYPANYDIPNSLNVVLNYYLTRRIIFSSILTYQTGKPVTYPESVYYVNGTPYLDYSKRNAYHIPDYMRADFSLTIEGNLKKNKLIHSSLSFNLYNATGRKNPYSVYFKSEEGKINSYQYAVIGVPIFTATWLFKFGNYATD